MFGDVLICYITRYRNKGQDSHRPDSSQNNDGGRDSRRDKDGQKDAEEDDVHHASVQKRCGKRGKHAASDRGATQRKTTEGKRSAGKMVQQPTIYFSNVIIIKITVLQPTIYLLSSVIIIKIMVQQPNIYFSNAKPKRHSSRTYWRARFTDRRDA